MKRIANARDDGGGRLPSRQAGILHHIELSDRKSQRVVLGPEDSEPARLQLLRARELGGHAEILRDEGRGQIGSVGVEQLPAQIGLPIRERGVRDLAIHRF